MVDRRVGPAGFDASRLEEGDGSATRSTLLNGFAPVGSDDRLYFLIGSDAFDEIETWHRWKELVALLEFIVVSRPGHDSRVPPAATVHRLERCWSAHFEHRYPAPHCITSAEPELPAAVRQYIEQHHLYGA